MDAKRGFILLLISFLVLSILFSVATEEPLRLKNNVRKATAWIDLGDYDDPFGDCDNDNVGSISWWEDLSSASNYYCADKYMDKWDRRKGCLVLAQEKDDDNPKDDTNDCGYALINKAVIIHSRSRVDWDDDGKIVDHPNGVPEVDIYEGNGKAGYDAKDGGCMIHTYNIRNNANSYICGSDGYWYECNGQEADDQGSGTLGTIVSIGGKLYLCKLDNDIPTWEEVPGQDFDGDGFTTEMNDCQDTPRPDEPDFCSEIESPDDCSKDIKNYQCAICINPAAPEICGDFYPDGSPVDNDCNPDTKNDCQQNRESCMQMDLVVGQNDDGEDITVQQMNIYGKTFDYREVNSEFKCCGFRGMDDLGMIASDNEGNSYICLNKELVPQGVDYSPGEPNCQEDWCWVDSSEEAFKIKTIEKVEQQYK
jgi:hypothetical protein